MAPVSNPVAPDATVVLLVLVAVSDAVLMLLVLVRLANLEQASSDSALPARLVATKVAIPVVAVPDESAAVPEATTGVLGLLAQRPFRIPILVQLRLYALSFAEQEDHQEIRVDRQ